MRRLLILLAAAFALFGVSASAAAPSPKGSGKTETAVFAGGCFWCMEHDMQGVPGVIKVESGYTGGHVKNPTYRDVTSERSGHYESVRVTYDPAKLDYGFLLYRYWKLVDPTDDGGQFCDRGPSYRPAVFVTPAQRPIAEKSQADAAKRLKSGHDEGADPRPCRPSTRPRNTTATTPSGTRWTTIFTAPAAAATRG
jgi:peptide-methionine (S)-S-oxide reductase